MITIASSILFLAFYILYYTSKKVSLSHHLDIEKWMKKNPRPTKIIGMTLLVTAYLLWITTTGLGVGTLLFIIALMTIGSLIVILKPLKIIPLKTILILFIIMELLEMYYS